MDRSHGGPLPRRQANPTHPHPVSRFMNQPCGRSTYRALILISKGCARAQGRLDTRCSPIRRSPAPCASTQPAAPRLACVRPVASVHPEPGSNSSLYNFNYVCSPRRACLSGQALLLNCVLFMSHVPHAGKEGILPGGTNMSCATARAAEVPPRGRRRRRACCPVFAECQRASSPVREGKSALLPESECKGRNFPQHGKILGELFFEKW